MGVSVGGVGGGGGQGGGGIGCDEGILYLLSVGYPTDIGNS